MDDAAVSEITRPNPLAAGLTPTPACILVIFGGAGDLSRRKLLPALYNLMLDGQLSSRFAIVSFSKEEMDDDSYRSFARTAVEQYSRQPVTDADWSEFAARLYYSSGSFTEPRDYASLRARLDALDQRFASGGNHVFYFAIPPTFIITCAANLHASLEPVDGTGRFIRIVVEKPLGHDLKSAMEINRALARYFSEPQIYRIDHYLGKETVQNMLSLRFANLIFEPLWNSRFVDHVQITVAEEDGVGTRAGYYDRAGALRDIVQNHIMQLVCMTGMEPPRALEPEAIRDSKLDVLRSLHPLSPEDLRRWVIRGQYSEGTIHGQPVRGYRQELGVDPNSITETFVAIKCFVENWRWSGVPFYLRTAKRLPKRATEISVEFNRVPKVLFNEDAARSIDPNLLAIRIQPDEGMSIRILSKVPGTVSRLNPVKLDFHYGEAYGRPSPDAYETLLYDIFVGDQTLFMRQEDVEAAWRFVQPILDQWAADRSQPEFYRAGEWGPTAADRMIESDGRKWRLL